MLSIGFPVLMNLRILVLMVIEAGVGDWNWYCFVGFFTEMGPVLCRLLHLEASLF